ncbi:MAG: sulfite exporter TauE/SafE family protein, partial [Armatimonadota bacterium]|nr:sulfite exporter TauE/SafE family protein [Armatimonadota bacterium]
GLPSVGIMLPMLICGDVFAVAWYRRHAQWDKLIRLLPWVVAGMAVGAGALWMAGKSTSQKDILGIIIGIMTLAMLALYLVQDKLDERLAPKSKAGAASTGIAAGFATMVSNAAGPVMSIYMAAHKLSKKEFIGTLAWYFFILNLSKLPVYGVLSAINPRNPIVTLDSLLFNLIMAPLIIAGAFLGKWLLPRIPQKAFDTVVLVLAALSAVKLVVG